MTTALAPPCLTTWPLSALTGVGPKALLALQEMSITTVGDLLFHLPTRYEDRTRITPIIEVQPGAKVLVDVELVRGQVQFGKRRTLVCRVTDGSGELTLRFFHFNAQQVEQLTQAGTALRCYGEIRAGFRGGLEMVHPEYRLAARSAELALSDCLTPIYATVKGITQPMWRKWMRAALNYLQQQALPELLPESARQAFGEMTLVQALQFLHEPPRTVVLAELQEGKSVAQQRLAFEELVAQQLGLLALRQRMQARAAPVLTATSRQLQQQLLAQLPFALTGAQARVVQHINHDLAQSTPMLRLVQGDVGSGKTVVAALALLQAVEAGKQGAMMAPTELLAEQHYQNLQRFFSPLGVSVGLLLGSQTDKTRRGVLTGLQQGEVSVVVGTHALFQDQVVFQDLALLVIDEQHRFGVHQRLALKHKGMQQGTAPHQLIMTATPIPRTLAMTAYADLDVSVIDELPPGRIPIQTLLISNERRDQVIGRVLENCLHGRQAYWVCTSIDEHEELQLQAVTAQWEALQSALPDLTVDFVHGRLKSDAKEAAMQRFRRGETHLLVATTVIEVGVDVPNATLMIIENPERLGLAQLHQLRGRIGRGQAASFCVLLYQKPLSLLASRRLQVMRDSNDGFVIAEQDLAIRGPGEVLGVRQTGIIRLKIADLLRDQGLLPQVKQASEAIVRDTPQHVSSLIRRWLNGKEHYAAV